jgi:hypothetical protein
MDHVRSNHDHSHTDLKTCGVGLQRHRKYLFRRFEEASADCLFAYEPYWRSEQRSYYSECSEMAPKSVMHKFNIYSTVLVLCNCHFTFVRIICLFK